MDPSLKRLSKFLSLVLRHQPQKIGLRLVDAGWVSIPELLAAANASGTRLDETLLLRVVHENDKQRFAISPDGKSIRASQGHSVEINLGLTPTEPPATLYHGTVAKFTGSIREKGLIPGSRQHVHLSPDRHTAEIVGKRRGKPVILLIDAAQMFCDGFEFYLSQNGVWLTGHVPASFIEFPNA